MSKIGVLAFDGVDVVFSVAGLALRTRFSGIAGSDFVNPAEIYSVLREAINEAVFDRGIPIRFIEILVPANFLEVKNGVVSCNDDFVRIVRSVTDGFHLKDVNFSAEILQRAKKIDNEVRGRGCVLLDVGLLGTTIAGIKGESLDFLRILPIGFGHLVNDLIVVKKIDHKVAGQILSKMVVTVDEGEVTEIVRSRIEELGEEIRVRLREVGAEESALYLSGTDFDRVAGARNFLGKVLAKNIKAV